MTIIPLQEQETNACTAKLKFRTQNTISALNVAILNVPNARIISINMQQNILFRKRKIKILQMKIKIFLRKV